ncbi:MAG: hypothetical protein ACO3VQ_11005 [Ilumatobacteraceae bacterium]
MADQTIIGRIGNALDRKYRRYFLEGVGGENLTFEERRLLDAVKNRPQAGQLLALTPYLREAGQGTQVEEDALYNAGVALGVTDRELKGLWERISNLGSDFVTVKPLPPDTPEDPLGRPTDVGGFGRGEISIYNADLSELAKVWRPEVINFLRTGDSEGLSVDEIRILNNWKRNPSAFRPDQLVQFGKLGEIDSASVNAFLEEWYRGYGQREVQAVSEPPAPVSTEIVGGAPGQVPAGSSPIGAGLEPGETSRPARLPEVEPQPSTADMTGLGAVFGAAGVSAGTAASSVGGGGVGGGGVGGGVSGVSAEPTAFDQAIPEDWRDAAREAYPGYYAIVRNIPEIAELLEDAIAEGFTEQEFQARLEQTNWWKQTTASAREWDINGERDPASQQTQIDNRVALIRQVALDSFGVRLGADSLNELANDSLRLGWTQQFLLNAIGDVATQSTAGISQLRAGYIGQQLRQTANDYGIAISDNTFNKFVNQIAVGQETQDSFQQYALTQAKNLFPSVSDRLDAGETFQQIVDPYREQAARLLEIDPDEIDFTQSEYVKALTYQDERGEQRPMSFTEFGDYIRQTRSFGYEYTDQARNKAYQVANDLANLFGKA